METTKPEPGLEPLTELPSELMAAGAEQIMEAGGGAADGAVTHAMITADGQTVPITLNPETGQYMTADGQTVEVQMASEEDMSSYEATAVTTEQASIPVAPELAEPEAGGQQIIETNPSSFQIVATQPQESQVIQQSSVVDVKTETLASSIIEPQAQAGGNIQLISTDGQVVRIKLRKYGSQFRYLLFSL